MAKKSFFSDIDWLKILFLTGVIIVIELICGWLNFNIVGGLLTQIISTGFKLAVGFGLYKLVTKKK